MVPLRDVQVVSSDLDSNLSSFVMRASQPDNVVMQENENSRPGNHTGSSKVSLSQLSARLKHSLSEISLWGRSGSDSKLKSKSEFGFGCDDQSGTENQTGIEYQNKPSQSGSNSKHWSKFEFWSGYEDQSGTKNQTGFKYQRYQSGTENQTGLEYQKHQSGIENLTGLEYQKYQSGAENQTELEYQYEPTNTNGLGLGRTVGTHEINTPQGPGVVWARALQSDVQGNSPNQLHRQGRVKQVSEAAKRLLTTTTVGVKSYFLTAHRKLTGNCLVFQVLFHYFGN